MSVVEIKGLTKTFTKGNVTALRGIDLQIEAGEFVSLIGPSGCGKSTLLRLIGDLTSPTEGTVEVNGKPAPKARADHDYGMVFQDSVLFDWRTVAKNVALPLEMLGWDRAKRKQRVDEMLEPRRVAGLRRPPPVAALRRHADARRDRARARVRAGAAPDGRAVRRARRDDARAPQHRAARDLAAHAVDRRVRHALDLRGGVPLDTRGRDEPAARAASPGSSTSTCRSRARTTRARTPRFFELVTEVRELLRGVGADEHGSGDRGERMNARARGSSNGSRRSSSSASASSSGSWRSTSSTSRSSCCRSRGRSPARSGPQRSTLWSAGWLTLKEALVGFAIGSALGILFARHSGPLPADRERADADRDRCQRDPDHRVLADLRRVVRPALAVAPSCRPPASSASSRCS